MRVKANISKDGESIQILSEEKVIPETTKRELTENHGIDWKDWREVRDPQKISDEGFKWLIVFKKK
jgi:hypothetical protein